MDGVEAQVVGHPRQDMTAGSRRFYKMSGSGNDFVFFNLADGPPDGLDTPEKVKAISARGTGVGADGVVFLEGKAPDALQIRYYNSDGSLGELCGNATLCSVELANRLGIVVPGQLSISTDAGIVTARRADGFPEIDLAPVTEVRPDLESIPRSSREERLGFVRAGVPHVVILDADVAGADIVGRGSAIRRDKSLRDGANVNFVSRHRDDGWLIRTYERGVEAETLACGTGAVASAILLVEWGQASSPVRLWTRSGRALEVTVRRSGDQWLPSLKGSAELVYSGELPLPGN